MKSAKYTRDAGRLDQLSQFKGEALVRSVLALVRHSLKRGSSQISLRVLAAALLTAGCARQAYHPQPVSAPTAASSFESRHLDDPHFKKFLESNLQGEIEPWPPKTWDLKTLAFAAFYFNPLLDAERARAAAAEAGVVTAGARPNPTLGIVPGVPSPYLLELDFAVPIQTAGKRGHQIRRAKNLSEAARLNLADIAWKVRSRVRSALLDYFLAVRQLDLLRSEEEILSDRVRLLEQRLAVGEIPRPEVDSARIELSNTRVAIRAAEGRVPEMRAELAAAIGIPVSGLDGAEFAWPDLDHPPAVEPLSAQQVQREAVLNRLDVRRTLAAYAAAEADLQLEISRQYPDLQIGPGYRFEERDSFFTVGVSITLPVFNRNRGPIAEAEARRKEAGATFVATQAQVIAESETAQARYSAALKELGEAEGSLRKTQTAQEQMARRALELGESDRLALNGVLLQGSAAAKASLDALTRAQTALGELEDAVQRPLGTSDIAPLGPRSPVLNEPQKGARK